MCIHNDRNLQLIKHVYHQRLYRPLSRRIPPPINPSADAAEKLSARRRFLLWPPYFFPGCGGVTCTRLAKVAFEQRLTRKNTKFTDKS
jgi:hypothetical protein